jgi:hypothetical protein
MASEHSSQGVWLPVRPSSRNIQLSFRMTRLATASTAHADFGANVATRQRNRRTPDENRERKTMHAATTQSIIAAAGLAAIGLVAWPDQATPPRAQPAVPTVHRDVALVDDSSILGPETTYDTDFFNSMLGPTGAEEQLYASLGSNASTLLDTDGASPVYSGDFNGAESRLFEGVFLDTLASEDQLNQALGVSATDSETAILSDITTNPGPPLPDGDVLPDVGATGFDTDLTSIANDEFTFALGDFEGYLASFAGDADSLSDLGSLGDLGGLGTDLSSILGDLGSLF